MDYSQSEINSMRQDALRRTREMHSRSGYAKNNVQARQNQPVPPESVSQIESSINGTVKNQSSAHKNNSNPLNGLLSGFFTDGKIDNDKILIIALIFILAKEGADIKLLIALGYIMM